MAGYSLEDRISDLEEEISNLRDVIVESDNKYVLVSEERDAALEALDEIRSIVKKYV